MPKKSKPEIEKMAEEQARGEKSSAKDSAGKGKLDKRRSKLLRR